jgi:hypothetical protein
MKKLAFTNIEILLFSQHLSTNFLRTPKVIYLKLNLTEAAIKCTSYIIITLCVSDSYVIHIIIYLPVHGHTNEECISTSLICVR